MEGKGEVRQDGWTGLSADEVCDRATYMETMSSNIDPT